MRLVTVLLGALALCTAGFLLTVYDYTRHGPATPASGLVPRVGPSASPAEFDPPVGQSPQPSEPAVATPPPLVEGLPQGASLGPGPIAVGPQARLPALPRQQEQRVSTPAPAAQQHSPKDRGRGHGKHGGGGGG
jgi:hypothetical protein